MSSISYNINLEGQCIAITGGGGHLGVELARGVAERGGDLLLIDRSDDEISRLCLELESGFSCRAEYCVLDLENLTRETADLIFKDRNVTGLVNNAAFVGTSNLEGWVTDFLAQDIGTWRRALDVNLTAPFALAQSFVSSCEPIQGSIVNISSIYGSLGPDWSLYEGTEMGSAAAYGASKGGLESLTKWLASTLGPQVRVNSVGPGGIGRGQPSSFVERYNAKVAAGRMADEKDVVGLILFLLSPLANYITGQSILVDGGYSIT